MIDAEFLDEYTSDIYSMNDGHENFQKAVEPIMIGAVGNNTVIFNEYDEMIGGIDAENSSQVASDFSSAVKRYEKIRIDEINSFISSSKWELVCGEMFDELAENNPTLLINIIKYFYLDTVDLAYAILSAGKINPTVEIARGYIIPFLAHRKGYVREAAAYSLSRYIHYTDVLSALKTAHQNETFDSVKSAMNGVLRDSEQS